MQFIHGKYPFHASSGLRPCSDACNQRRMKAVLTFAAVLFVSATFATAGEKKACDQAKAECPQAKLAAKQCSTKKDCPVKAAALRSKLVTHKGAFLAMR
jgi:hypothetical protein